MNDAKSSQHEFWDDRWEHHKMPWDLGCVPPSLMAFLDRSRATPMRVLIPGCGSGYEVRAFHEAGHAVTAIDFSEPAVACAREVLGPLGDRVLHGDFFAHEAGGGGYGMIYERGFLCSLPREMWPNYAAQMARLLGPGGRLVGIFLYGHEPEPPPFPLTETCADGLLSRDFRLLHSSELTTPSVPVYQGMERWQEWERIAG